MFFFQGSTLPKISTKSSKPKQIKQKSKKSSKKQMNEK
jgi:hypothetical protein